MIKDIVDAGGAGFLIPAVLFALLVFGIKGVFGLFFHKRQTRKEFLEHWDISRANDDLWLEVTICHQFGQYLPAPVIRLALAEPHKARALMELSDIWPLLRFEAAEMKVSWKKPGQASKRSRAWSWRLAQFAYYAVAMCGLAAGGVSYLQPSNSLGAWVYGVLALVLLVMAAFLPEREEALRIATIEGDAWVARINGLAAPSKASATLAMPIHATSADVTYG